MLLLLAPGARAVGPGAPAFVPQELLDAAAASPDQIFRVIVQGTPSQPVTTVEAGVEQTMTSAPATGDSVNGAFTSIGAVAAELTGEQIELLAADPGILAITPDMPLRASVADPPVALEPPTVTGTPQDGATLSASSGQWSPAQLDYAYQWQRCDASSTCSDITGATTATYDVATADVGSTLVVVVTGTNADGTASSPSVPTATVDAPAPAPQIVPPDSLVTPALTGVAVAGEMLSVDDGLWSRTGLAYDRQWERCSVAGDACLSVDGAASPTYTLSDADVGFTLRVVVTATDGLGSSTAITDPSDIVQPSNGPTVQPTDPPQVVTPPSVTGTPTAGQTLTADDGQWTGAGIQLHRNWQRCDSSGPGCTDIAGSTGTQYALTAGDDGYTVRVVVTASDGSASAAAASDQTAAVAPAPAPAPPPSGDTSTTTATGTSGSGSTNSGSGSTNSGSSGITSSTSTSTSTTSTSSTSTSTSTTSTNVSTLTSTNVPTNDTPPIVVGNPVVGTPLWAMHGTWLNVDDHPDYYYRWQRCNITTALCANLNSGSRWYTPVAADVGSRLQVLVTVSDNGDHASATSDQTDRVAPNSPSGFFNWQLGPYAAKVDAQWTAVKTAAVQPPAIAVVDSGVDPTLPGLGSSVVDRETFTSLPQSAAADGYGHGSFVAQVAAGDARGDAGASPTAPIVSLDVMNDDGMALTSDVVEAADWIYTHKAENNIKVANFSLIGGSPSSIMFDPLDRALERLWFSGVVVVTAAGNFAKDGQQSDEPFAPANDPFVITVGASDTAGTVATTDDSAAPWSAYGHTFDGFEKPELSAPGRYVVESVPTDSTLYKERPDRVVAPGQIELSGTSFAAPMVSGIAANLLALHPDWKPDQVKGALMLTAAQPTSATGFALGVGVVDADAATAVTDPPKANAALDQFVVPDPNDASASVFDTASWGTTAQADASWGTASWGTASWGTASWGTASWGTTYWSSASWGTASWGTASWGTASWGTASWGTDNALSDLLPGGYPMNFG